jgi:hypothetical protein
MSDPDDTIPPDATASTIPAPPPVFATETEGIAIGPDTPVVLGCGIHVLDLDELLAEDEAQEVEDEARAAEIQYAALLGAI